MNFRLAPTVPWLLLYVVINLMATVIMLNSGELIGDVAGSNLYSVSALVWAAVLVIGFYVVFLWPVFNFVSKIKITSLNFGIPDDVIGKRIGIILVFIQLGFMFFNLSEGVNVAGSNNTRTSSLVSIIWVLVPADALFIIYYGMYRDNKLFKYNLVIWLVSNLMRGWAGVIMFVVFFEWCRLVYNKRSGVIKGLYIVVLLLLSYPILLNLKWLFRASVGSGLGLESIADALFDNLDSQDYLVMIGSGVDHIIGRIQVISLVVEVMRLRDLLQSEFLNGGFTPFWMEGLHGVIYERLFIGERSMPIGVAFTQYAEFNWEFEVGNWNTNIGYVGWFFIAPYLVPVYIAYTLFLCFVSFYVLKKIGATQLSKDMLWFVWLVYLMAPWLAVFVNFIYALCVFFVIKYIFSRKALSYPCDRKGVSKFVVD